MHQADAAALHLRQLDVGLLLGRLAVEDEWVRL